MVPFLDFKFTIESLSDSNNEIYTKFENISQYQNSEMHKIDFENYMSKIKSDVEKQKSQNLDV